MLTRETELAILYEIASISAHQRGRQAILDLALDKAIRLLGGEVAICYLREPDAADLRACASRGIRLAKVRQVVRLASEEPGVGAKLLVWAEPSPFPFPEDPLLAAYPVRAALGVPIRTEAYTLGWLYVARINAPAFTETEVSLFNILGDRIAGTLEITLARERDRLQEQALVEANQRLEQMLAEITAAHDHQERLLKVIQEISTPVLRIAEDILLLPLIGTMDPHRSKHAMETVLQSISYHQAQIVIVDITGISMLDTHVANTLLQAAQSANLLGASVIVCGIRPEVAQTIISLGIDLKVLHSASDLQTALLRAFRMQDKRSPAVR
jgi:anti-anti-sigma factor